MTDQHPLFAALTGLAARPAPYALLTTPELWTDPHLAGRMLAAHLDPAVDLSTYRASFVARALTWLTETFQAGPGVRVADLGCGPGLYATPLARTGARVTGIDLSEGSLAYARREAAREGTPVRYVQGDYLEWGDAAAEDGERYDLVLLVMRDYCALAPHQRARLLAAVRERLAPGGSFVLDVDAVAAFSPRSRRGAPTRPDWWTASGRRSRTPASGTPSATRRTRCPAAGPSRSTSTTSSPPAGTGSSATGCATSPRRRWPPS
ncbi:class I SAM-dependent methyltransferase [Streptomyces sp. C-3]